MMLNKNKSNKTGLWKYGFTAPLFVLMLVFSAAFAGSTDNVLILDSNVDEALSGRSGTMTEQVKTFKSQPAIEQESKAVSTEAEKATPVIKPSSETEVKNVSSPADTLTNPQQLERQPEFDGGMRGFGEYLGANIKYPAEAKAKNVQGRVIVSFIVQKDGSLDEVTVLKGIESTLDAEALRVVKNSPKWKPGIQNGRPVKVAYTMPINFNLPPKPEVEKTN